MRYYLPLKTDGSRWGLQEYLQSIKDTYATKEEEISEEIPQMSHSSKRCSVSTQGDKRGGG